MVGLSGAVRPLDVAAVGVERSAAAEGSQVACAYPPPPPPFDADAAVQDRPQRCPHYRRRCRIIAPCCGGDFGCHRCHDDALRGRPEAHELDRRTIREALCQRCGRRGPADEQCSSCSEVWGAYHCGVCNVWDDDGVTKQYFHCEGCGICRVGGRDNFFHCDTCGACYPNEIRGTHKCVEKAMGQNCPVCLQDLFASTMEVIILQCGHTIHQACLRELQMSFSGMQSLRCPICNLSLYKYEDLWAEMDRQVAETPMPQEFRSMRINIACSDCQEISEVPFHVLGHKCPSCGSYNTRRAQ